jgi:UDP-glucose 4-epimerase
VDDIARAHVLALDHAITAGVYNLGSNTGTSNREIMSAAERITGKTLTVAVGAQRVGDPPMLTASADKFNAVTGTWQLHNLDDMIRHAWAWYV